MTLNMLAWLAFGAAIGATAWWLILKRRFWGRVRDHHPEIWQRLGRQRMVAVDNSNLRNEAAARRFLWRREYQSLNDSEIDSLARQLRWSAAIVLILYVANMWVIAVMLRVAPSVGR